MKSKYYCPDSFKCLDYPEGCHSCKFKEKKVNYYEHE